MPLDLQSLRSSTIMYNQEVAARVYAAAYGFAQDARRLLTALEERND